MQEISGRASRSRVDSGALSRARPCQKGSCVATGFGRHRVLSGARGRGVPPTLSPRRPTALKAEPYECGMEPGGHPWAIVRLRFAAIAMIFVLFDAESALLFSVAGALKGSWLAAAEIGAFALMLALGLAYAWKKGALEWRS